MKNKYTKCLEKGMVFGRLTVIEVDPNSIYKEDGSKNPPYSLKYLCECSCPNKPIIPISRYLLVAGRTKSCGCLQKEIVKRSAKLNRRTNRIEDCGDYIKIFFNTKEGCTIIDKENYHKVKGYCWYKESNVVDNLYYAVAHTHVDDSFSTSKIRLHHLLLPKKEGLLIDHIDGDGLNNTVDNLRYVNYSQSAQNTKLSKNNTSGHVGVSFQKKQNKWRAFISVKGKFVHLGTFNNIEDAIRARKEAEDKYYNGYTRG